MLGGARGFGNVRLKMGVCYERYAHKVAERSRSPFVAMQNSLNDRFISAYVSYHRTVSKKNAF